MTRSRLLTFAALLSFVLTASVLGAAQNMDKPGDLAAQSGARPPAVQQAQNPNIYKPEGRIITPPSDSAAAGFVHTNYHIFVPKGRPEVSPQLPTDYQFAETPASLGCVYQVGPEYTGCNPVTGGTNHPDGGWGAIVLVDAYDDPNAAGDLAFFSSSFGLPAANFRKVYANAAFGTFSLGGSLNASCLHAPPFDANWALEESLDIEWAHAMAPSAQIVLVEACTNSLQDMFFAEAVASVIAQEYGGGDISNSWGAGEGIYQLGTPGGLPGSGYDNLFYRYGICNAYPQCTDSSHISYFASAGDSGWGPQYPSTSPWIVSAGGTTVNRDITGNYLSESCWSGSGGGPSTREFWQNITIYQGPGPWAEFQYGLFGSAGQEDCAGHS